MTERERETRKGREVGGGSGERERETRKGREVGGGGSGD